MEKLKLKINYWPILRTPNVSQNSLDGKNNDQLLVQLNGNIVSNFRLEQVNIPSNIYGHEEVVDIEEGTGRNEGRLGAFICKGEDERPLVKKV